MHGPAARTPLSRFPVTLDVTVRRCAEADLEGLEWYGLYADQREVIRAAFDRQATGEVAMLVADLGGFPVGQAWIEYDRASGGPPSLWAVRVLPPLRRHGIGARLLAAAEDAVRAGGSDRVSLTVERSNPAARRFYERLGYREVGRTVTSFAYRTPDGVAHDIPLDLWVMLKRLDREGARAAG
ncbi:MAG TPA: GNAT family N-acetyltransferase [Azospirillaceae bacterium]|nr:GNAT family N-acetyltransferase [Azospirillaceae bacterium]